MKHIWLTAGVLALAVEFVGIVLPLVPPTPSLLQAACAAAESSPTLHQKRATDQ